MFFFKTVRAASCAIAVGVAASGCSLMKPQDAAISQGPRPLSIAYRTESDRLNLGASTVQQASFMQNGQLPGVTHCTLAVIAPHPNGQPDAALATVSFRPAGGESVLGSSVLDRLVSRDDGGYQPPVLQTYSLDIPRWQAESVVAKLRSQNFFRNSRVLDPKAFLAVRTGDYSFGKNYKAVPELDALIMRVRQQGRAVGDRDLQTVRRQQPMLSRLPQVPAADGTR